MKENIVRKNSPKAWLLAARPKTLTGAAVPVMIGLALAYKDISTEESIYDFNWIAAVLCMLFAFIMQIDANFVNDFFDFAKGTDDIETRLGPRRACAQGWVSLNAMKHAIASTTCLACLVGLPLVLYGGLEMILVGIVCVLFCFLYTTHLSYMGLGDVLVLVFFGIVPVCIIYYIQLHTITLEAFLASIACGVAIDALLLVNNYRDRDTDKDAGKKTIVVRMGETPARYTYLSVGLIACLIGIQYLFTGKPLAFILPLIYLVLHFAAYVEVTKINRGKALNKCLATTARNIFIYGLLVAIGILY